jgi:two-component system nitrogen regulation sensor histidine kinase GlnL
MKSADQALYASLNLAASAMVLLDHAGNVVFMNLAAEQLFECTARSLQGQPFWRSFLDGAPIEHLFWEGKRLMYGAKRFELSLTRPGREPLFCACTAVVPEGADLGLVLEFQAIEQRRRVDRENRIYDSAKANHELLRNLAHEIKNPLGGIRGAAQLLEIDLPGADFREYTQVIINEADRLQTLVDRLLAPQKHLPKIELFNIHQVCDRVGSLITVEYPKGITVFRDYDASLPEIEGDLEQLIQAVLNLARNAAQAMQGQGTISFRTRIARQVTIGRVRHRLALDLHVIDNGPGVPPELRESIFYPLVTGRAGGSGLGLSMAQSLIQQHGGIIEFESKPGETDFKVRLPLIGGKKR